MDKDPSTSFESFAVVAAGLRERTVEERITILDGLNLTRRWAGIQSQWAHVIMEDLGRGDITRANHFMEVCEFEREQREKGEDVFAPASKGEPITPELLESWIPITRVVLKEVQIESGPPSVTMECEPAELSESEPPEVEVTSPHTLNMGQLQAQARIDPPTLIPAAPQRLTARSASDAALEATRRALRWSVEHYAAFAASLSLSPNGVERVAAEFEIPAAIVEPINDAWNRRLEANEELRASYLVHYEASLQHRKPTS